MADAETLQIEVAFAGVNQQKVIRLSVAPGTTVTEAIAQSGLLQEFPEIDPAAMKTGIYSRVCPGTERVRDGDRVEIYRPLIADPKEARKARAAGIKKTGEEPPG